MRVLLVEDERKISRYVKRGLEEQGYAVDAAFDGREALDWIEAVEFDLIVLDILLPKLDGLGVCREIRRRGVRAPVLMLTARDTVGDRVTGLDCGADDYLVKPFAFEELLARLRALSRRSSEAPRPPVLQVADLSLDTRTRTASRGGQLIDLKAKEYAVLECLMRDPERIFTRELITEHVWSYDDSNVSNVIDVYIRNLRRKLDDPFEHKLIRTVRGQGYCITAEDDV